MSVLVLLGPELPSPQGALWASSLSDDRGLILRAEPSFWRQGLEHPVDLVRNTREGAAPSPVQGRGGSQRSPSP